MIVNTTKIKVVILLCILIVIAYLTAAKISNAIKAVGKTSLDNLPPTYKLTKEDSSLIGRKYFSKFKAVEIVNSKTKNPVSFLTMERKYFSLIYKINIATDVNLENMLKTSIENSVRSNNVTYTIRELNQISRFQWNADPLNPASNIYVTLYGDSVRKYNSTDSTIGYRLMCKNLSIKYSEGGPIDVYLEGQNEGLFGGMLVGADLLFVRRSKYVYFMLLTGADPRVLVPYGLLLKIVNDE